MEIKKNPISDSELDILQTFALAFDRLAEMVNGRMHEAGFYDVGIDEVTKQAILTGVMGELRQAGLEPTPRIARLVLEGINKVTPPRNKGEVLALIHGEISEALEFVRKPGNDDKLTDRPGEWVELGDAIIRILDWAGEHGVPLGKIIADKILYNIGRPYKHGKEF